MFEGFTSEYRHTIDSKDRLTIPADYRARLEAGCFVMYGFDHNLMVMPPEAFEVVSNRLNKMSITNDTARLLKRMIFSKAKKVELDKAGRILIPAHLQEMAGLKGEVVLAGVGDYFEVWSLEQWAVENTKLEDTATNNQLFATLDLSTSE
jgi:MraZ protein